MIIKTIKGDLIKLFETGEAKAIAHGCNCFHRMGSGIARQIADKYPQAPAVDRENTKYGDRSKLGSFTVCQIGPGWDGQRIYNLYTQYDFGTDSRKADYTAISKVFAELDEWWNYDSPLYIPMIGAGLAGGDWNVIQNIINQNTKYMDIVVVEYLK